MSGTLSEGSNEDSLEKAGTEGSGEGEGGDAGEGHPQCQQDSVPDHRQHARQNLS